MRASLIYVMYLYFTWSSDGIFLSSLFEKLELPVSL